MGKTRLKQQLEAERRGRSRNRVLQVRVNDIEDVCFKQAAAHHSISVSDLVRQLVLREWRRLNGKEKR